MVKLTHFIFWHCHYRYRGGMYVAAGIGAGPRDGFMLTISDKTGLSISRARIIVECVVLVIGFMLGGPVFVVTFLYTFIQSPIFQQSFKMFQTLLHTLQNKTKSKLIKIYKTQLNTNKFTLFTALTANRAFLFHLTI